MSNPAKNFPRKLPRADRRVLAAPAPPDLEPPAHPIGPDVKLRVARLRELLMEADRLCQFLSSAVNTPDMPAECWLYVDVARCTVLSAMRGAQVLQLQVQLAESHAPAEVERT